MVAPTEIAYFRQMWMRFFEGVGKICYDASDAIIALYEGNRLRQIEDGADPAKTTNVPNGIDVARAEEAGELERVFKALADRHRLAGGPEQDVAGRDSTVDHARRVRAHGANVEGAGEFRRRLG